MTAARLPSSDAIPSASGAGPAHGAAVDGGATVLPAPVRARILGYLGGIIVLQGLGDPGGGLIGLPMSFFLKNHLHMKAHEAAAFWIVAAIPVYFGFVFGFIRDTFNPFGMGDRGFIVLFGSLCAIAYVASAFVPMSYWTLLTAYLFILCSFLFVVSAQNGLTTTIARQHVMSGQVSTAWNTLGSLLTIAGLLLGGMLSDTLEGGSSERASRALFLVGGGALATLALYGLLLKPRSVFDNLRVERVRDAPGLHAFRTLLRHKPIYPALLIWFLWNFNPGIMTPLQYHLQNHFHASDVQWAQFNAVLFAGLIPSYLLFGRLCQTIPLRRLLLWGTLVAVPQMISLLFIDSVSDAMFAGAVVGILGGFATAAYLDLIMRSCPPGLQGTVLMMSTALLVIAQRIGDVVGANLYDRSENFGTCVVAVTVAYALILPVLLLVPKQLIATADGQIPAVANDATA